MKYWLPLLMLSVLFTYPLFEVLSDKHLKSHPFKKKVERLAAADAVTRISCQHCGYEQVDTSEIRQRLIHTTFRLYCGHCGVSDKYRLQVMLDAVNGFPHDRIVLVRQEASGDWKLVLHEGERVGHWT